jgi:hypothetical protein
MGFASTLIRFFFSPVVFPKGGTDPRPLRDILDRLRNGKNVCLFAEGNRSFSGRTNRIAESTGKLARFSGAALITYRLRGGYFVASRWGRKMRKGPIWGESVGYYSPQELKSTVGDWWFWQYEAMERIVAAGEGPICSDERESLFAMEAGSRARVLGQGRLSIGRDGLRCGDFRFPLKDILELAITGQRTLAFAAGGKRYELKNKKNRNAAKYQRVFELLL